MLCDLNAMTLVQSHDIFLGIGQKLCKILLNTTVGGYGPDRYVLRLYCDLNFGDITLVQGHDTLVGHGQQLCKILSRSDKALGGQT